MNKVPKIIVVMFFVYTVPLAIISYLTYQDLLTRETALERACVTKIMETPKVVEIVATPTASPSPSLRPFKVVSPIPATGGAK